MNAFFSPSPIWLNNGLALVRIIVGLLMLYHGLEIFDSELMKGYTQWDTFKGSLGVFLVYCGKGSEFVAGILLTLGLLTRPCAIMMIGTFSFITFIVGNGKFWYEDQHPFMFVLFGLLFFFTGPGAWSVDRVLFKQKS